MEEVDNTLYCIEDAKTIWFKHFVLGLLGFIS